MLNLPTTVPVLAVVSGLYVAACLAQETDSVHTARKRAEAYLKQAIEELTDVESGKLRYVRHIQLLTRAIEADSSFARAYNLRGLALLETGHTKKALSDFQAAVRLAPKNHMYHANRGLAHHALGQSKAALDDLKTAVSLCQKDADVFCYRGVVAYDTGDYQLARSDFFSAVNLQPKEHPQPEPFDYLARFLAACPEGRYRDGKLAVSYAKKACEIDQYEYSGFLDSLAAAHAQANQFDQAVRWQKRALEMALDRDKADLKSRLDLYQNQRPYRAHKMRR